MSSLILIIKYSFRILRSEWKKYFLPFLSIFFTSLIVVTVLLITDASSNYLESKSRELLGGDIKVESNSKVDKEYIKNSLTVLRSESEVRGYSETLEWQGVVTSNDNTVTVNIKSVDSNYPLYGQIILQNGIYKYLDKDEIIIDKNASSKLNANVGNIITINNKEFRVKDIINSEPSSILAGFRFFPTVIISEEGVAYSGIDTKLLRADYNYLFKLDNANIVVDKVKNEGRALGLRVDVAGDANSGIIEGLSIVQQFLTLAILLSCVLASVNIYSGVMYIIKQLRKSFAVLLSIGMRKRQILAILFVSIIYIVLTATSVGAVVGILIFKQISYYIGHNYDIILLNSGYLDTIAITFLITISTALASYVPALQNLLSLSPKNLLSGNNDASNKRNIKQITVITVLTLSPLFVVAIFLLQNITYGVLSILTIALVYVLISSLFFILLGSVYRIRHRFGFMLRSIISSKKHDGIYGIISITSLYIALSVLCIIVLLQASLNNYLSENLSSTIPSTYILDIQPTQKELISRNYSEIKLYPNIRARIIDIDGVKIQDRTNEDINGELRREFNISYNDQLDTSEKLVEGVYHNGSTGQVSVDAEFARRANIKMGSFITFNIQGFPLVAKVTSLRETNSRSGLPFFYFLLPSVDLSKYPTTYFGYADMNDRARKELGLFISTNNMSNVSIIDTSEITALAKEIIGVLLLIIIVISIPPLILALFLIATLIVSTFADKRKESAQLLSLGATYNFITKYYIYDSLSITIVTSILAYMSGLAATIFITKKYLKIGNYKAFDTELIIGLILVIIIVIIISIYLWNTEKRPLKELLNYE